MRILQALALGLSLAAPVAMAEDVAAVIAWSQRVELGTLVSGVVERVHVRPGQTVVKGDSLVSLDGRGFRSEVARTLAAHRHAQARLEEAQREDERAIELYDRTVLSDFERNLALIGLKGAQAAAEAARAAWLQARLDLERSVIRAPFDGVVLAVNAAAGQTVVSELQSAPLVTLADTDVYLARAQVGIDQAGRLATDSALRATARGRDLEARVQYVGLEPVAKSERGPRYELVAEIRAPDDQVLRVGETVILHLE
jgi:multidrug efflux system membrane fusion protein